MSSNSTSRTVDFLPNEDPGPSYQNEEAEGTIGPFATGLSSFVENGHDESRTNISEPKKPRYAHGKNRTRLFEPPLESSPTSNFPPVPVRTALDLDDRFFPSGIKPGRIIEVKGPQNSGKTFFLTYLLAKLLTRYPTKTALLIDTSHQFSLHNLVAIICRFDDELKCYEYDKALPLSTVLDRHPKLNSYLDRLSIVKCYSAEEFIVTLGPVQTSLVKRMIECDPNLSLVTIDTVDNYSFTKSFSSTDVKKFPNILKMIFNAVSLSKTPVICTTIIAYPTKANFEPSNSNPSGLKSEETKTCYTNILIDPIYFTHSLEISPATQAEKHNVERDVKFKDAHYATAYLRSRHKANMAGSANHRVKFSIFSDMLWVDSEKAPSK